MPTKLKKFIDRPGTRVYVVTGNRIHYECASCRSVIEDGSWVLMIGSTDNDTFNLNYHLDCFDAIVMDLYADYITRAAHDE